MFAYPTSPDERPKSTKAGLSICQLGRPEIEREQARRSGTLDGSVSAVFGGNSTSLRSEPAHPHDRSGRWARRTISGIDRVLHRFPLLPSSSLLDASITPALSQAAEFRRAIGQISAAQDQDLGSSLTEMLCPAVSRRWPMTGRTSSPTRIAEMEMAP